MPRPLAELMANMEKANRRQNLHVYTKTLTISYLNACVALEEAAFPSNEAATPEKIAYRLNSCPELALGLFTSADFDRLVDDAEIRSISTAAHTQPVDSACPSRREVLVGHVMCTMMNSKTVTDDAMAVHQPRGQTIGLHSLAVAPELQGIGLGSILLNDYLQRMACAAMASHVAIIVHEQLLPYYQKAGFVSKGKSASSHGGVEWFDMTYDLKEAAAEAKEPPSPAQPGNRAKEDQRKKVRAIFAARNGNVPVSAIGYRRSI